MSAPRKPKPKRVLEKIGIYVPPEIALELRFEAARQRRKLSAVAEDCLTAGMAALNIGKRRGTE
jgi:hypothetical protein